LASEWSHPVLIGCDLGGRQSSVSPWADKGQHKRT
jgi:hypothetical protein